MPSTNANGYPYPLPGEPVAQGAANIKALADALPPRLVQQRSATAGQTFTPNGVGQFRITWPTPFESIPLVQVYCFSAAVYFRPVPTGQQPYGLDGNSIGLQAHSLVDGSPFLSSVAVHWSAIGRIAP